MCLDTSRRGWKSLCQSFIEVILLCKAYILTLQLNSVFVRGISMRTGAELTQGCGLGQRQSVVLSTF